MSSPLIERQNRPDYLRTFSMRTRRMMRIYGTSLLIGKGRGERGRGRGERGEEGGEEWGRRGREGGAVSTRRLSAFWMTTPRIMKTSGIIGKRRGRERGQER